MKVLKLILALVVIGAIGWAGKWYFSRPSVPTVEQVAKIIAAKYGGNKLVDGGTPLVKVSVNRVSDIQRVGYNDFTAIADVMLVFNRDPSNAVGKHLIARGMMEKDRIGREIFKTPRKKGESIAKYLPEGTTRKLSKKLFEITYNKYTGSGPIWTYYWSRTRH